MKDYDSELDKAKRLYSNCEYEAAIQSLDRLIHFSDTPQRRATASFWMALCHFELSAFDEAAFLFENCLKLSPEIPPGQILMDCHHWLGRCYIKLQEIRKAEEILRAAEKYVFHYSSEGLFDDLFNYRITRGNTLWWLSDYQEALDQFREAEDLIPKLEGQAIQSRNLVAICTARVHLYLEDLKTAEEQLNRVTVVELHPDDLYDYHLQWIQLCSATNRPQCVLEHFAKLIDSSEYREDDSAVNFYAGQAYYRLGDARQARHFLELTLKLQSTENETDWIFRQAERYLAELPDSQ